MRDIATFSVTASAAVAPPAPPGTNNVRGVLVHGQQALARVAVELCTGDDTNVYAVPCATTLSARTDAAGVFTFASVPDGHYRLYTLEHPWYTHTQTVADVRGGSRSELGPVHARTFGESPAP